MSEPTPLISHNDGLCKSRLIVVDGLDGSGKSTQTELLYKHLKEKHEKVLLISYPDYQSQSSALVRMYLNGDFSKNADEVNPYAASSFYAVDRYASFKQHWESYYNDGYIIIATRYVSSNAIHQMSKLDKSHWDEFLNWLDDYEYKRLGLPRPDSIIFLDMPREAADKLLLLRYSGDEGKKDIHESNAAYMAHCQKAAYYAADAQSWNIVHCSENGLPLSMDEITRRIIAETEKIGL